MPTTVHSAAPPPSGPSLPGWLIRRLLPCLALLIAVAPLAAQESDGSGTLPRFVSLAADVINVRTGPGRNYPVRWVYARQGLPVKIVETSENWRMIEDKDGERGWIHGNLLSRRRTVMVDGKLRELRRTPSSDARIVLRAEPGVIARLHDCSGNWCLLEIDGRRGWLERGGFWGTLPDEQLN